MQWSFRSFCYQSERKQLTNMISIMMHDGHQVCLWTSQLKCISVFRPSQSIPIKFSLLAFHFTVFASNPLLKLPQPDCIPVVVAFKIARLKPAKLYGCLKTVSLCQSLARRKAVFHESNTRDTLRFGLCAQLSTWQACWCLHYGLFCLTNVTLPRPETHLCVLGLGIIQIFRICFDLILQGLIWYWFS